MKSIKNMNANELRRILDLKDAINGLRWSIKNIKNGRIVKAEIKEDDNMTCIGLDFGEIGCNYDIENQFIKSAYKSFFQNLLKSHKQLLETLVNAD